MIKITADKNNKQLAIAHARLSNAMSKGLRSGAYQSGKEMVSWLTSDMAKPKTGRKYRINIGRGGKLLKRTRLHIASSPTETPAVITGDFRKSIDFVVHGSKYFEFGSGAKGLAEAYAAKLENGDHKMAARQPVKQTVDRYKIKVKTNLTNQVNRSMAAIGFKVSKV